MAFVLTVLASMPAYSSQEQNCEIVLPPHEERHCTTRLEVPGLIPGRVLGNSDLFLLSTKPLIAMSTSVFLLG